MAIRAVTAALQAAAQNDTAGSLLIKFSEHEMLEMGQKAVAKGYVSSVKASNNYLKNYQDSQQINGIKFRYYIDKDTKGVTNVHPE